MGCCKHIQVISGWSISPLVSILLELYNDYVIISSENTGCLLMISAAQVGGVKALSYHLDIGPVNSLCAWMAPSQIEFRGLIVFNDRQHYLYNPYVKILFQIFCM